MNEVFVWQNAKHFSLHFTCVLLSRPISRPFRADPFIGRFPGLKPRAEIGVDGKQESGSGRMLHFREWFIGMRPTSTGLKKRL
jgi:hypothetical protein